MTINEFFKIARELDSLKMLGTGGAYRLYRFLEKGNRGYQSGSHSGNYLSDFLEKYGEEDISLIWDGYHIKDKFHLETGSPYFVGSGFYFDD